MDEHIRAYTRLRLEGTREELETARDLIARGHARAAVSRAYYAVFYMASGARFSQSVQRAKHSGVESAFSEVLVKPGHVEPEFGRLYRQARNQAGSGMIICAGWPDWEERFARFLERNAALADRRASRRRGYPWARPRRRAGWWRRAAGLPGARGRALRG